MLAPLYQWSGFKRAAVVWMALMVILWGTFGLSTWVHPNAYTGVEVKPSPDDMTGAALWTYIVIANGMVLLFIAGGNMFARFGRITPGLIVLLMLGIQIGWMAGANGFEYPFASMAAANLTFLRVGLWETSAYALICAVTLPKSLLVSATFPPREWTQIRMLADIRFDRQEIIVTALAIVMWLGAAISETLALM